MKSLAFKGIVALTAITLSSLTATAQKADSISATYRPFQLSFVPYLGTNGTLSKETSNAISINIIGGISKEVRNFEMGGIFNIVTGNTSGFQGAGITNLVSGDVRGCQGSGIFNKSKSIIGFQGSGIANINSTLARGYQASGIFNKTGELQGFQGAGIANIAAGRIIGSQFAGITNICNNNIKGLQGAGIANVADSVIGGQFAGITSIAKSVYGVQAGGLVTVASTVRGTQLSALINKAKVVKGSQVGLINIADTVTGASVGLINIVKNGYVQYELAGDDIFYSNIALRSGVQHFHSIVSAGIRPDYSNETIWTLGFGVGTSRTINAKTLVDFDLLYNQIMVGDRFKEDNKLFRVYLGIDRYLFKHVSIAAGITANALVYSTSSETNKQYIKQIIPYSIVKHNFDDHDRSLSGWIGGRLALRFN